MTASVPDPIGNQPRVFDIIVAPDFVLTEFAGVVDILRLANRVTGRREFEWRFYSVKGGRIASSSSAAVDTEAIPQRPDADFVFVIGNSNPDHPDLSLLPIISRYTSRQVKVVLLAEAASRFISERGDSAANYTTHWENRAVLLERHGLYETKSSLVVDSGEIITSAGMESTFDLTLSIINQFLSSATMMTIADIQLHDRIRHHNTLQPFAGRSSSITGDPDIDRCINLMQSNIELPLSISEIADTIEVSKRSMERKFYKYLRTTPNGYYREIRLSKANNLLLNTDMAINEIGLACGFPHGFSSIYKKIFGTTPNAARTRIR
jgi:transcriptional regulator GlxA family with amidase domain